MHHKRFRAGNFRKIAAKSGKTSLWCRSHDGRAVHLRKNSDRSSPARTVQKFFRPKFFWFECLYGRIFYGSKFKKSKKNPDESPNGPDFSGLKSKLPENFGTHRFSLGGRPDYLHTCRVFRIMQPPLRQPCSQRERGRMRCCRYYLQSRSFL